MQNRIVVPSIPYLSQLIFKILSSHPLLNSSLVTHPTKNKPVPIKTYRFMDGFPLEATEDTVVCAIFPSFAKETPASPSSTSVSTLYKSYDLGMSGHEEVIYHFVVKFFYQEVVLPGTYIESDKELITTSKDHLINQSDLLLISQEEKEVELSINPGLDIIGDYLELSRLALLDINALSDTPIGIKSLEVIHQNYPSPKWDGDSNIFVHNGNLLLRVTTYSSRGWRNKFLVPMENFNVSLVEFFSTKVLDSDQTYIYQNGSLKLLNSPECHPQLLNSQGFIKDEVVPPELITEDELETRLDQFTPNLAFDRTFTDTDLTVAGLLPIAHNLNKIPSNLKVLDEQGEIAIPDSIHDTENLTIISLQSYRPLQGTWKVFVTA